jgi:hypothetical protein
MPANPMGRASLPLARLAIDVSTSHDVGLDRAPHHCASCARCRTTESVDNKHAVDHVGQHRDPRPTFDAHRHGDSLDPSTIDLALHGAINALEPRRTAETWHHKPCGARHLAK